MHVLTNARQNLMLGVPTDNTPRLLPKILHKHVFNFS